MNFRSLIAIAWLALAACSNSPETTPASDPTALVKLATAKHGNVEAVQTLFGAVEQSASAQATLSAPIEATVARIALPVGSPVRQGQMIVALAPSPSSCANIAQARTSVQTAEQAFLRAQRLRSDGLVSDAEVESARATVEQARASITALATQTGQLALRAPFAGFVETIASNPGELVAAGTPVVTLTRSGDMRARFNIDHALLSRLSRGEGVRVTLPSEDLDVTLPIIGIDPTMNQQTRQASLFVSIPASYGLGGGQPLRGEVTLEVSGADAVVVPYAAILDDGGQPYVFTVSGGTANRKDVTLGASGGNSVAIASGLASGEQVVIEGATALEDGMKVRTQ